MKETFKFNNLEFIQWYGQTYAKQKNHVHFKSQNVFISSFPSCPPQFLAALLMF